MLEIVVLFGLACAYVVRVALFEPELPGPFESSKAFVQWEGQTVRSVNLFDRLRRLFGAYKVSFENGIFLWSVWVPRMQLWMCPKCLSFYCAMPFAALAALLSSVGSLPVFFSSSKNIFSILITFLIIELAVAFVAQFLVFLQLRIEDNHGL